MEQNFWEQRNLVKMNFGEMTSPIIFGAARAREKLQFLWDHGNIYPPQEGPHRTLCTFNLILFNLWLPRVSFVSGF